MGGGDLNSKKSWHPNTMKNQERVWMAEQAAAEEKKRIQELQHERAAERDRAQLNELAKRSAAGAGDGDGGGGGGGSSDARLHWMYDKPDKKAHHEDYLLGKAIEKNYDQPEKSDDVIPAVARRIVGSSMITSTGDSQVDLARKMREDPLLLVKERERAARAALLNNPIHRKRLAELLRKEQEERKGKKEKSKKKDNLDTKLAAKLNALGGDRGLDIAALLASDDSSASSDSDEEESKKKKKKNVEKKKAKKTKKKKKEKDSDSVSSDNEKSSRLKNKGRHLKDAKKSKVTREIDSEDDKKHRLKNNSSNMSRGDVSANRDKLYRETRKRKSGSSSADRELKNKRNRRDLSEDRGHRDDLRRARSRSNDSDKLTKTKRNRRDSSIERKQRNTSREDARKRSESHDSDKDTRNRKYSKQNRAERRHDEGDYSRPRRRQDSSGERTLEVMNVKREEGKGEDESRRRTPEGSKGDVKWKGKRNVLSAEERAAKLAEMAAAGVEREVQRGLRVAQQLARQRAEDKAPRPPPPHRASHSEARALPDSLESRIHSNRHYIQRDKRHMNEHFARR